MDGSSQIDATKSVQNQEFRQLIERQERLISEQKDAAAEVKEGFAEIKSRGYLITPVKKLIKIRASNPDDIAEEEAHLEMYKSALGM